jgi:hypothetical protein
MCTDGDEAGEEPKKRRDAATGTGGVRLSAPIDLYFHL